jgi:alkanesulfonate monooxygenase SsuD/methylene tetrahydromethanopterin reductase-like flavin-dependent oxidoreductase (luciferase family)
MPRAPTASRSSACTCTLIAFIGGRSSRIVARPSVTCTFTHSPMQASWPDGRD